MFCAGISFTAARTRLPSVGGKPEKVRADNRHQRAFLLQHQRPHRQVALPLGDRVRGPTPPLTGSSGSGVDGAHRDAGAQARKGIEVRDDEQ